MGNMLVRLFKLANDWSFVQSQQQLGIIISTVADCGHMHDPIAGSDGVLQSGNATATP
jgi:hypothetical protein